jgi:hypothetical protein
MVPLEDDESKTFASYLDVRTIPKDSDKAGVLKFSHIANESAQENDERTKIMMSKKKAMGVRKGIPDFFIAIQNRHGERHCLWIEMKRRRDKDGKSPSRITPEQSEWIDVLSGIDNTAAHFAYGFEEAKNILDSYLK